MHCCTAYIIFIIVYDPITGTLHQHFIVAVADSSPVDHPVCIDLSVAVKARPLTSVLNESHAEHTDPGEQYQCQQEAYISSAFLFTHFTPPFSQPDWLTAACPQL